MKKTKTVAESSFMYVVLFALLLAGYSVFLTVRVINLEANLNDLSDTVGAIEQLNDIDAESVQS